MLLITRGEDGVFAFSPGDGPYYDGGYKIKMKDNIGSGIAFSAGFLHYYLNGKSISESLHFGNAAGALNATLRGATHFFSKEQVLHFMKTVPKRNN
jgi:fructokinase